VQAATLGAAILAATASGAFADLQAAAASMAHAGGTIRADPARRAFHDAKYGVYLALCDDWCHYRRMMDATH
jgi:ribulose kinase